MVSSFSTDDRLVMSVVPWRETHGVNVDRDGEIEGPATKHTQALYLSHTWTLM
jgi:hypothetical protein